MKRYCAIALIAISMIFLSGCINEALNYTPKRTYPSTAPQDEEGNGTASEENGVKTFTTTGGYTEYFYPQKFGTIYYPKELTTRDAIMQVTLTIDKGGNARMVVKGERYMLPEGNTKGSIEFFVDGIANVDGKVTFTAPAKGEVSTSGGRLDGQLEMLNANGKTSSVTIFPR